MIGKEKKKRTDMLAKLYGETNDLLAEMERSAIAGLKLGLRKEAPHKSSPRKEEAEGKGGRR